MTIARDIKFKSILLVVSFFAFYGINIKANEQGTSVIDAVAQVIKPSKALLPGYAPEQVPAESGIYFQMVAESYDVRIKRDIIGKLRQAAQVNSHSKELLYLFNQLPTTKTVKQVIALLTRAISAHQSMMTESGNKQDVIAMNDRVYSALLLQSSVVLTNNARDQLLAVLDEIAVSLVYWKDQKNHPVHYFFHKSPLKWLTGKSQSEEIASNIKKLERLQHSVRSILGRMTHHIYEFNPNCSVDELYTWTDELISILFCIGKYDDKPEHTTRFDKLAAQLRFKVSHVDNLTNVIFEKMTFAKKPSHYVRNWIAYTAAMIAIYKSYSYYNAYSEDIHKAASASFDSIRSVAKESIIDPVKGVWRTVTGADVASEEGLDILANELNDKSAKLKELSKEIVLDVSDKLSSLDVSQRETAKRSLMNFFAAQKVSAEDAAFIIAAAEKDNLEPLEKVVDQITTWSEGYVFTTPSGSGLDALIKGKAAYYELLISNILTLVKDIAQLTDKVIVPSTRDLVEVAADMTKVVVVLVKEVEKILKQNRLTMQFVALIPAGGAMLGLGKLYNWMTARDYSAVRLALIEINSLFIEAKAPLSDADYGKLIYLLQGLKAKAMRYIPVKENLRDDFLADIAKLESQQFSVETKRRIIKNMFNKYPFLSLNTKTA